MKWVLGVLFVVAGAAHFVRPDVYVRIMPPYLPWHRALVYVSGLCEVALGALLLIQRFTIPAAWGLIALLIGVFPANLHMAMDPLIYSELSPFVLWLRLQLQGLVIALRC